MAQYYAITFIERRTIERGAGRQQIAPAWFIASGPHASRKEAEDAGKALFQFDGSFTTNTKYKNLRVIPASQLKAYHIHIEDYA